MRGARALAAPLVVVVLAAPFLLVAAHRASWTTLGRDQGIFQYVAWAIARGDKLYSDVRDVNGPLVALVHFVLLKLGGADEHRFRVLDLAISSAAFLFVGSSIPDLAGAPAPRRADRIAWALAAWCTLLAQYLAYGYWDTAQRESFFDWFVLAAIALHARARLDTRRGTMLVLLAGAASIAPCFGKPTYALFTLAQVIAIGVERRRSLATFFAGGAAGAALLLAFLFAFGDPASFVRITFSEVPAMYRFIWPRPPLAILALPGYSALAAWTAIATSVAMTLVALRRLPVRAAPAAAMPLLGVVSALVQAKGFPYHFHPASAGVALVWLVVLAWTDCRWHATARTRAFAVAFAAVLGARAALSAWRAPYPPASPPTREHLAKFDRVDFFPNALRDAAAHVAERTGPDERVQAYGMDAYVLFLAGRASATPYIHAYDLDADAALAGSYDDASVRPDEEQARAIRALRDAHERDLLSRVEKSPPAAFVFVGRSPLMTHADAFADFRAHCPDAAQFVLERYHETADFEGIRVWMRNDRAP